MRVAAINRAALCLFVCLCKAPSLSHLALPGRLAQFSILTLLICRRRVVVLAMLLIVVRVRVCVYVCVGSREHFTVFLRLCVSSVAWLPLRQRRCHCRRRQRCCCGVVSLLQFAWQLPVCCLPFGQRQSFSRVLVLVFLPCFSFFLCFTFFLCCFSSKMFF